MKTLTKSNIGIAAAVIVAIFAAVMLIVPGFAHAQYYGAPYHYGPDPYSTYNPGGFYSPTAMSYTVPVPVQVPVYVQAPVYLQPLTLSCSANVTSSNIGQTVIWSAYASGGQGNYYYTWNGTDGLRGNDRTAFITYTQPGQKYASVTVYSGGQSITQNCVNSIAVYAPIPVFQPVITPVYTPVQTYPIIAQRSLDVGCFADPNSGSINQPVTWNAEVTGGVAPYRFSWTGTDGLYGSDKSIIKFYATSGEKYAVVTVTSADGLTTTRACSNAATIRKAATSSAPAKTATTKKIVADKVVVVSPNVTVVQKQPTQGVTQSSTQTSQNQPIVNLPNNGTQVAGVNGFSLANVPWGWVAGIVIALLFFTVVYLVFNRNKI